MADDFIQVAPDSTGKKVDNTSVTTDAGEVYRQTASLGDPDTALRARILDADPPTDTPGIAVRVVGTIAVEPMAHASSHAVAGSDPVTIAQSQVTGLVADLAALAASSGWTVISNADVGTINDWAPAGFSGNTLIEWNGASDFAPTGLAGGFAGQLVIFKNISTTKISTFPDTGASLAAAQFKNYVTSAPTPVAPRGQITYQHDGTNWKIVGHEQGAAIVPAYNAADYTASVGNWVVDSGDVIGVSYYLRGRRLNVLLNVNSTSVSSTPVSLQRKIPGGFQASAAGTLIDTFLGNPGGTFQQAQLNVGATATVITFYSSISTAGSWTPATTNSTSVSCNIDFEVQ